MAGDLKTQIAVGVDGSGVTAGVENIKNTLDSMGKKAAAVGKQASEGIDRIGDGAAPTAAKVDAAAKNMIGSIQRQIAAMEAGSKSGADYYRVLAGQRGIDTSVLAPYLAQLDAVAAKQKAALQAGGSQNTQGDAVIAGLREQIRALGMTSDELLKYKAAQAGVGAAAAPLILQLQNMRAAQEAAAQAARDEARAQREVAAAQAGRTSFLAGLQSQAESIGKTRSQLLEMQAAQMGLTAQAAPFIAKLKEAEAGVGKVGVSAGQTAQAMRQLPAQFSDVIVSLQGGQNPISVFLQQGSQIRDSFGSFGAAARAVGGFVAGLVTPLTVGAAAIAVLGVAAYKGSQELSAYQRAIDLSGNAAGVTAGQLDAMAASLKSIGAGTQSQAAEALTALAATGQVGAANLQKFAATALLVQRTIGTSVADTAKAFAELAEEPLRASEKLNKGTNYLTLSIYEQIKALEDQGRKADAAAAAQVAYDAAQNETAQKLKANLGTLETLMNGIAGTASRMWDAILAVGRTASPEAQLESAQRAVASLQQTYDSRVARGMATGDVKPQLDAAIANLSTQRAAVEAATKAAAEQGEKSRVQAAGIAAANYVSSLQDQAKGVNKVTSELEKYYAQLELVRKANPNSELLTPEAIKAGEEVVRRLNAGKSGAAAAAKVARADLKSDIQGFKDDLAGMVGDYGRAERLMESQRSAGLLDEASYYAAKRQFIEQNAAAKIAEIDQENARMRSEKAGAAERIDLDRQIEMNLRRRSELQKDAANATQILAGQEETANRARAASYLAARQAAESYLETMQKQQDREVAALGQGERARQLNAGRSQIEDRYEQQRRDAVNRRQLLEAEGKFNPAAEKKYDQEMALIAEFQAKALSSYEAYWTRLRAGEADWTLGAAQAIANYRDESANVFRQVEQLTTNAFKGMEDALVSFATTGKADFKSLANSIIADLVRIQVRASITSAIGSASGGGLGALVGKLLGGTGQVAFSQTSLGSSGFGTGLAYGNQDMGQFFADGGYTGPGAKYQPAGLVHAGEYVINAESTRKLGLDFLGKLNGYAEGGIVAPVRTSPGALAALGLGGGGMGDVIIHNYAGANVEAKRTPDGKGGFNMEVFVREVGDHIEGRIAENISSGIGPAPRAIEGRYGLQTAVG